MHFGEQEIQKSEKNTHGSALKINCKK